MQSTSIQAVRLSARFLTLHVPVSPLWLKTVPVPATRFHRKLWHRNHRFYSVGAARFQAVVADTFVETTPPPGRGGSVVDTLDDAVAQALQLFEKPDNVEQSGAFPQEWLRSSTASKLNSEEALGSTNLPSPDAPAEALYNVSDQSVPSGAAEALSSAQVDPFVIPLPPLPPIATPGQAELSFTEMGLNSWWPHGWIQNVFEYCHDYKGFTWMASLSLVALVIRLVTFPLFIRTEAIQAQDGENQVKYLQLMKKRQEAKNSGDWIKDLRAQNELAIFMRATRYKPHRYMMAPLIQAPIFISVVFAIRGMTTAPVESMKTGGFFWFTDLTLADPYFLLPLFNVGSLWAQMELGIEMQSAKTMTKQQKWLIRALPVVLFPILCFQSSALAYYWSLSIWLAFFSKIALRNKAVRRMLEIPEAKPIRFGSIYSQGKKKDPLTWKGLKKRTTDFRKSFRRGSTPTSIEKRDESLWREAGLNAPVKTYKFDPTKNPVR